LREPTAPLWRRIAGLGLAVAVAVLLGEQLAGGWLVLWLGLAFVHPELVDLVRGLVSGDPLETPWGRWQRQHREAEKALEASLEQMQPRSVGDVGVVDEVTTDA
jgi:hypothetical protein